MNSAIHNIPIPSHNIKINASTIPFPTKGVKLSYIHEFYDLIGGKEQIKQFTTTEINDIHQKKITEKYKLSFVIISLISIIRQLVKLLYLYHMHGNISLLMLSKHYSFISKINQM